MAKMFGVVVRIAASTVMKPPVGDLDARLVETAGHSNSADGQWIPARVERLRPLGLGQALRFHRELSRPSFASSNARDARLQADLCAASFRAGAPGT